MYKAIFTKILPSTKKQPKRIKTYDGGLPVNYLYQERFSDWENHALACQNFCKINNIYGQWNGALVTGGMVFVKIFPEYYVDEFTIFYEE